MLFAPRFVYIHEPKTGGTFVIHVVTQLHGSLTDIRASRLRAPSLRLRAPSVAFYLERLRARPNVASPTEQKYGRIYNWNDHGSCNEIPAGYRSRSIVGTVRHPLQTYVSLYLFGWWKRPEFLADYERRIPDFRRRHPDFPNVSFREYLSITHAECARPASRDLDNPDGLGYLTERFVRFYFRRPIRGLSSLLRRLESRPLTPTALRKEMYPVQFLHTSRLNDELREFLLAAGYAAEDLEFVATHKHVVPVGGPRVELVGRAGSHDWRAFYTPDLETLVRSRERLYFTLFPELDSLADA